MLTALPLWQQIVIGIGAFLAFLQIIQIIAGSIPAINRLRARIISFLAEKFVFQRLEKEAIASDVMGPLNEIALEVKKELPSSWIKPVSIEWVRNEKKERFFKDGRIILRMRPLKEKDNNFLAVVYYFLKSSIFPITQEVIPNTIHSAVILQIVRRTAANRSEELAKIFEDDFMEPEVKQNPQLVNYLEKFEVLDGGGMLTGAFIREYDNFATKARFRSERNELEKEADGLIEHSVKFLESIRDGVSYMPEDMWFRKSSVSSFKFLLVARPSHGAVQAYLRRAESAREEGVERLYVLGAQEQLSFVKEVISKIKKSLPGFELIEEFYPNRDYRGDIGGVGALFIIKKN